MKIRNISFTSVFAAILAGIMVNLGFADEPEYISKAIVELQERVKALPPKSPETVYDDDRVLTNTLLKWPLEKGRLIGLKTPGGVYNAPYAILASYIRWKAGFAESTDPRISPIVNEIVLKTIDTFNAAIAKYFHEHFYMSLQEKEFEEELRAGPDETWFNDYLENPKLERKRPINSKLVDWLKIQLTDEEFERLHEKRLEGKKIQELIRNWIQEYRLKSKSRIKEWIDNLEYNLAKGGYAETRANIIFPHIDLIQPEILTAVADYLKVKLVVLDDLYEKGSRLASFITSPKIYVL